MTKSGDQWLFCPSDSVTLCWTTKQVELLTKSLKSNREVGIYACIASNDLGTEIALSNLVDPEQPSEWLFALSMQLILKILNRREFNSLSILDFYLLQT